jgi:hypothetical protein
MRFSQVTMSARFAQEIENTPGFIQGLGAEAEFSSATATDTRAIPLRSSLRPQITRTRSPSA